MAARPSGRSIATFLLGVGLLAAAFAGVRLDRHVEDRFQRLGAAPSRIYARPLVLQPGMDPVATGLGTHLGRVGYRLVPGPEVERGEFVVRRDRWILGVRPFRHARGVEPGGSFVAALDPQGRIAELSGPGGEPVDRLRIEPAELGAFLGPEQRDSIPLRFSEVPERLVDAVLVTEDRRFFEHRGIDLRRIVGAAIANLRSGRIAEGGSTITQQLVRSVYLTRERTVWRKLQEIAIALLVELRHEKQEILEAYLNEIYMAQRGGVSIHGFALAARHYFGRGVEDLSLAESALLAGIVQAPNRFSPLRDPAAARERRNLVLRLLRETGRIDEAAYEAARESPLGVRPSLPEVASASYFTDFVGRRMAADYGEDSLSRDGLVIHTSLDLRLQARAEGFVRARLERMERRFLFLRRRHSPLQAAMAVLEPQTGQLLVLIGGRDYRRSPFNRAVSARRQPGSIFKPVVVLAALTGSAEGGARPTLASILPDEPFRLRGRQGIWSPANHDERFRGEVTVREALEQSLNVPMVHLAEAAGLGRVISTARRLGIESPLQPVLSLPLGTFELSPLEITRTYAALAAEGSRVPLSPVLGVLDRDGEPLMTASVRPLRVFTPAEIHLVTSVLQGAADRGTAAYARKLGYRGALAAKTGSTDDFRDAWFVGYTPELTLGVWTGFDDNRRTGLPGSALALPIAIDLLAEALGPDGAGHFRPPPGVERRQVWIEKAGSCRSVVEFFLRGTTPTAQCEPGRRAAGTFLTPSRG
ncbi:MAG: transglycosylase domain-containing protein [Myxococcota bacterium]